MTAWTPVLLIIGFVVMIAAGMAIGYVLIQGLLRLLVLNAEAVDGNKAAQNLLALAFVVGLAGVVLIEHMGTTSEGRQSFVQWAWAGVQAITRAVGQ